MSSFCLHVVNFIHLDKFNDSDNKKVLTAHEVKPYPSQLVKSNSLNIVGLFIHCFKRMASTEFPQGIDKPNTTELIQGIDTTEPIRGIDKPHISFGIISDVHYVDCEDGADFTKTRERFYRNALNLLKNAVNDWKRSTDPVAFVLQLGDLIDGKNKNGGEAVIKKALNTTLHPLNSLHIPVYHVIGNHELYNLNRSFFLSSPLNSSLSLSIETNSSHLYYTFLPHPKLRIVALDAYEISLLGYGDKPDDENYKIAQTWFREHNVNEDTNDVSGLDGLDKRWAAYNGGVGEKQLRWLSQVLMKASTKEENVIIVSHVAMQCQDRNNTVCLAWNYSDVLDIVHQYQCVIGIFAGHEHAGWDYLDSHGVQHVTFQGIIETRPGGNAYATAHLWDRSLTVVGVGRVPSFTIALRYNIC